MKKTVPGHTHPHPELPELTSRLRRESRKVTAPRQAILDFLRRHEQPATIREIFSALPAGKCDLATIYRIVNLLVTLGMVKRCDFGDGSARYELVPEGDHSHHHHLVCTRCAAVVKIADCVLGEIDRSLAKNHGFKSVTHKLEFFGLCPACQR